MPLDRRASVHPGGR